MSSLFIISEHVMFGATANYGNAELCSDCKDVEHRAI